MNRISIVLLLGALFVPGLAAAQLELRPASLEECYLDVAARKGDADAVHLARELCDEVFRRGPRSLTVFEGGECVEWWFDAEGRYESADVYCSLEAAGSTNWKLACQWKTAGKPFSFVELAPSGGQLVPVAELRGKAIGSLFSSLGACIEQRANGAGVSPR